ncbi:uncharacterized protein LOC142324292 [Lycorma delicatula]|uniref:uncharacterized protein LOC142324292 n=1 Tax=Lycorma delicatula TaxID=130591 RepID=UPI003F50F6AD
MQEIWMNKDLGWDESVPDNIKQKWSAYRQSLISLNQLTVDRRVLSGNKGQRFEIHGFSDASEKAFGACIYIRTIESDDSISVKLLCSKSQVAPIKSVSLPRLELWGARLVAELLYKIRDSIKLNIYSITLWTDSMIVLHRLNSPAWQAFVSNRVAQIQELTGDCIWKHVRSQHNPGDLISRSTTPSILIS